MALLISATFMAAAAAVRGHSARAPVAPAAHHWYQQQDRFSLASARPMQQEKATLVPALNSPAAAGYPMALALNARDFDARGDNKTDDTAALQRAIDAAQQQGRALAVPSGLYRVSRPLFIRWTENDDCAQPTCPGSHHPLRLFGESMYATAVVAMQNFTCVDETGEASFIGAFGCAVLSLPGLQQPGVPPWVENFGKTTTDHDISHIGFDANYKARFGLYAPIITRSRLEAIYATKATFAGILVGNGWCNYLLQVRCWENTIGIVLVNAVNNVNIVNSILEDNAGAGILVVGGFTVNLEGNTIESSGGPAIVASSIYALNVQSNYFEDNNCGTNRPNGSHYNVSFVENGGADHYPLHSDIALGVRLPQMWWTRAAIGVADPIHDMLSNMSFTTGGVCDGVTITGNHFTSTKSAVLLGAARAVQIHGNTAYWDNDPSPTNQMALITAGGNCSRFFARDVSFSSNSASYFYLKRPAGVRMAGFSKWVEILEPSVGTGVLTSAPYTGQSCNYFHTYAGDMVKKHNFAAFFPGKSNDQWSQVATSRWGKPFGTKYATITQVNDMWDGHAIYNWTRSANVPVQSALVCSFDLATTPSLAGTAVYLSVLARLPRTTAAPNAVFLTLGIDPGDGKFRYDDGDNTTHQPTMRRAGEWTTFSYQAVLNPTGIARFALFNWQESASAAVVEAVQMSHGSLVVAAVGARFNMAGGEQ